MAAPTIAVRTPTACAACYGQYPDRVHIDYRSALDGAQIRTPDDNPRAPFVEWAILCENCIRAGFELLPEQASERENLIRQVAQLTERAEAAENYASTVEDAMSRRPAGLSGRQHGPDRLDPDAPPAARPKPQPKPKTPPAGKSKARAAAKPARPPRYGSAEREI